MKRALLLLAMLAPAAFGAVPTPLPLVVNSHNDNAPLLQLYRGSPRTIRVQFKDGTAASDLTGLTTNDLHLTWNVAPTSTAYVASDVALVDATNGTADFTFTSQDLNYAPGLYYYEASAGSTIVRQGRMQLGGGVFSTGTNSPAWTTNVNLSGYTFSNYPWITDAPSDGTTYGRQDGGWAAVTGGSGSGTLTNILRGAGSSTRLSVSNGAGPQVTLSLDVTGLSTGTPLYVEADAAAIAQVGAASNALNSGVVAAYSAATNAGNTAAQAQVLGTNALASLPALSNDVLGAWATASNAFPRSGGALTGQLNVVTSAQLPLTNNYVARFWRGEQGELDVQINTNGNEDVKLIFETVTDWWYFGSTNEDFALTASAGTGVFYVGRAVNSSVGFTGNASGLTNLQASALAPGGVLPALDGSGLTNLPSSGGGAAQSPITNNVNGAAFTISNVNVQVVSQLVVGPGNTIGATATNISIPGGAGGNVISNLANNVIIGGSAHNMAGGASSGSDGILSGTNCAIERSVFASTIAGGRQNRIGLTTFYAFIGGGYQNGLLAQNDYSVIGGGELNSNAVLVASWTFIGGGRMNRANANFATIPGGASNTVAAAGGVAIGSMGTVAAGGTNSIILQADPLYPATNAAPNSVLVAGRGGLQLAALNGVPWEVGGIRAITNADVRTVTPIRQLAFVYDVGSNAFYIAEGITTNDWQKLTP